MSPAIPAVLAEVAGLLLREAMSGAAPDKAQDLALSAALVGMVVEGFDGHVHRLVEENRAVRVLLGETGEDSDLHVSALTGENHRLRALLIARHAAAEAGGDTALVEAIWAELAASAERRRVSSAPC
jgi:hypothetical protein